jgi:O-antigen/teichoic acid export membrane protein
MLRTRLKVPAASGAMLLSIGTVASGVLAYAFNVLAARALGPERYGPVALLWAALFLVSVVLFRPVEQTLSRGISDRLARGSDPQPVVRSCERLCFVVTLAAVAACLAGWRPITDGLFDGQGILTASLIAGIVGYAASYFLRGLMGGVRWFAGYGTLLLADGLVRVVLAVPLVFVASEGLSGVAVAGAAIGGALAPLLLGARHELRRLRSGGEAQPFDVRDATSFAAPAAVVATADQLLVSGGPLLVVLAGAPDAHAAAGTVFAATMLVRAPVFLFQGFAAALLPSLTTLRASGERARFRRAVTRVALALAGFAAVLTLGALAAGPEAMRLLYGPGFDAGRADLAILALGVGCYLTASTCSQAALAQGQAVRAMAVWATSGVAFVLLELLVAGDPLHKVSVAFALAAALNALLFFVLVLGPGRREIDAAVAPALS